MSLRKAASDSIWDNDLWIDDEIKATITCHLVSSEAEKGAIDSAVHCQLLPKNRGEGRALRAYSFLAFFVVVVVVNFFLCFVLWAFGEGRIGDHYEASERSNN